MIPYHIVGSGPTLAQQGVKYGLQYDVLLWDGWLDFRSHRTVLLWKQGHDIVAMVCAIITCWGVVGVGG